MDVVVFWEQVGTIMHGSWSSFSILYFKKVLFANCPMFDRVRFLCRENRSDALVFGFERLCCKSMGAPVRSIVSLGRFSLATHLFFEARGSGAEHCLGGAFVQRKNVFVVNRGLRCGALPRRAFVFSTE